MKRHTIIFVSGLAALALAGLGISFSGCQTPPDERLATPWIKTRQLLTLLSANDGQAHLKQDAAHMTSNERKSP